MDHLRRDGSPETDAVAKDDDTFDFTVIAIVGLIFSVAGAVGLGLSVELDAPPTLMFSAVVGVGISILTLTAARHRRRRDWIIPVLGTIPGGGTLLVVIASVVWIYVGFSIGMP